MAGVRSKHDEFFKAMMKDLSLSQDFIKTRLPEKILRFMKLGTTEVKDSSFIDSLLNESHSDILLSVQRNDCDAEALLYVLCEHQSRPDALMPFRVLYYIMQILRHHVLENEGDELPLPFVYPIVVYNGVSPWPYDTSFFGQFGDLSDLAREILMQPFPLLDVETLDEADLLSEHRSNLMLASLRRTKNEQTLEKKLHIVNKLLSKLEIKNSSELGYNVLSYLAKSIISADGKPIEPYWGILKQGFAPEYQETVMNLIDATKKEARQQGIQDVATNLLQTGVDLITIAECTGLSVKKLKDLEQKAQAH